MFEFTELGISVEAISIEEALKIALTDALDNGRISKDEAEKLKAKYLPTKIEPKTK